MLTVRVRLCCALFSCRWPCPKGYSVCMWVRWEAEPKPHAAPDVSSMPLVASSAPASRGIPIAQPVPRGGMHAAAAASPLFAPPPLVYLYSFLTDKARGIEALIGKHAGHIVVRSVSRGVLQELNTQITLPDKKWAFLTIWSVRHRAQQRHALEECGNC